VIFWHTHWTRDNVMITDLKKPASNANETNVRLAVNAGNAGRQAANGNNKSELLQRRCEDLKHPNDACESTPGISPPNYLKAQIRPQEVWYGSRYCGALWQSLFSRTASKRRQTMRTLVETWWPLKKDGAARDTQRKQAALQTRKYSKEWTTVGKYKNSVEASTHGDQLFAHDARSAEDSRPLYAENRQHRPRLDLIKTMRMPCAQPFKFRTACCIQPY